ncbi:MAG TPA: hypothetical protein VFZ48_00405 [Candidatus Saccharimonadales bacterium]
MARLPIPGSDSGQWGDILNQFLDVEHNSDGSLKLRTDTALTGKYTKPGSGIPLSDLAAGVQSSISGAEQSSNKGQANGYASLDSGSKVPVAQIPTHASTHAIGGSDPVALRLTLPPFSKSGVLFTETGTLRLPIDGTYAIVGVRLMAGTAPTGADIIVDINKNGTTIFTTQANRPTIAAGANSGGPGATPNVTALAAGDYITVDIDQVGSTVAGSDLVVSIIVDRTA